jgi:iron-sulfur cluster assembly accessory protein
MQQTITKDMLIGDVVMRHPPVADVLLSYGLHCVGCHVNQYETIEMGAMGHGMTSEEVEEMVAEANAYLAELAQPPKEFTATMKAVEKLKELAAEENKQKWGLRVGIANAGCCSPQYELEFEEKALEDDVIINPGFMLYLRPEAEQELRGGKLDYIENEKGSGFRIDNPKNKKSCGCKH